MNAKIKEILEKHEPNAEWWFKQTKININNAIIEICDEQASATIEMLHKYIEDKFNDINTTLPTNKNIAQ